MTLDFEYVGVAVSRLPAIATGDVFPKESCTTYVILHGPSLSFFNTHAMGFKISRQDYERRFAPAYDRPLDDGQFAICYAHHRHEGNGHDEGLAAHFSEHKGLSDHAISDVAKLMQSNDRHEAQIGNLFKWYASPNDKQAIQRKLAVGQAAPLKPARFGIRLPAVIQRLRRA